MVGSDIVTGVRYWVQIADFLESVCGWWRKGEEGLLEGLGGRRVQVLIYLSELLAVKATG